MCRTRKIFSEEEILALAGKIESEERVPNTKILAKAVTLAFYLMLTRDELLSLKFADFAGLNNPGIVDLFSVVRRQAIGIPENAVASLASVQSCFQYHVDQLCAEYDTTQEGFPLFPDKKGNYYKISTIRSHLHMHDDEASWQDIRVSGMRYHYNLLKVCRITRYRATELVAQMSGNKFRWTNDILTNPKLPAHRVRALQEDAYTLFMNEIDSGLFDRNSDRELSDRFDVLISHFTYFPIQRDSDDRLNRYIDSLNRQLVQRGIAYRFPPG